MLNAIGIQKLMKVVIFEVFQLFTELDRKNFINRRKSICDEAPLCGVNKPTNGAKVPTDHVEIFSTCRT
jgi:hypothetical protein